MNTDPHFIVPSGGDGTIVPRMWGLGSWGDNWLNSNLPGPPMDDQGTHGDIPKGMLPDIGIPSYLMQSGQTAVPLFNPTGPANHITPAQADDILTRLHTSPPITQATALASGTDRTPPLTVSLPNSEIAANQPSGGNSHLGLWLLVIVVLLLLLH